MLLAAGLLIEFARFLKIMSWIVLPVFLSAVVVTIIIHYRRKKKKKEITVDPIADLLLPSVATQEQEDKPRGAYLLFDHSGLIKEYQHKLTYNHARYAALKHDFDKLELKYQAALHDGKSRTAHIKNSSMENNEEKLQNNISPLQEAFAAEKEELLMRLTQLNHSCKKLEEENGSLQQQIGMQTATEDEKNIIFHNLREENRTLNAQVKEQQYLQDLLKEKKAQIEFLQNQLEQRVKSFHEAEQNRVEANQQLEGTKEQQEQLSHELALARNELIQKQKLVDEKVKIIHEKETQLQEKQQAFISNLDRITYLDNVVKELRQQNEMLNADVADHEQRNAALFQQVEDEQTRTDAAERKLAANKQMLLRVYKEFSSCVDEEMKAPPVITLRPAYINADDWEETAVQ
ncbi:MAG TPA: hypothetical protein VF487_01910 [Chitinophagaceae bacterium]